MSDQNNHQASEPVNKSLLKRTGIRITVLLIVILSGIFTIKGMAIAMSIHKPADSPEGFIIDRISESLDLNTTQKAQLQRIKDQIREKRESDKAEREDMLKEFSDEFTKNTFDKNVIIDRMKENESKKEEMKNFMIDKLVEFHDILTPEQRSKVVELLKGMNEKKDKHQQRGPGNFHEKEN